MVKNGLLLGDFHCGHLVGLTPPEYQHKFLQNSATKSNKWYKISKSLWSAFTGILKTLPPLDFLVINGDMVEGKGPRSGGTELITSDMHAQCDMATQIIQHIREHGKKNMHITATFGCLTPGHKILTSDLRWVGVETLKTGDKLLAFDEEKNHKTQNRYYRESIVINNKRIKKLCYKLYFSDGTTLVCSHDHRFLNNNLSHNDLLWESAEDLYRKKMYCETRNRKWSRLFKRAFDVWSFEDNYTAGLLSGFFDGEGCLYKCRISAWQKENKLYETVLKCCLALDIPIKVYTKDKAKKLKEICIKGGRKETLKFLGRIRPERLLDKFECNTTGAVRNKLAKHLRLVDIKPVGKQTVCALGTTSKTYIAEGFLCHNTDYHTSTQGDDWEQIIKDKAKIDKIGSHEWLDVNGLIFDIKHYLGSSATPYGRHTAISKEAIWNELWALTKQQPRADVIVRSHVHYFQHCGTSQKLAMTLPALQGMGSKFGARKCSGLVDWGVVLFQVTSKNDYEWHPIIRTISAQKTKAIKI